MLDWENAILRTIEFIGGNVSNKQIYDNVSKFKSLSRNQLRETEWGDRPAFQHTIRTYLSNLVKTKLIERVSRGVYRLTEKAEEILPKLKIQTESETNAIAVAKIADNNIYSAIEDEAAIEGYKVDSISNRIDRN